MEFNTFETDLKEKAKNLGLEINKEQAVQFYNYMNMLITWNEKVNLTAIKEPEDIILKHFIDSLTIANYIKDGEKIADVGTGAGFPGIPIKILKADNDMVLIDSLNKRIKFLNEVIEQNGLKKVTVKHARAEDIGHDKEYRGKFDIVLSRAVAKLSVLLEYMMPLVKVGGKCICMKGPNVEEEIKEAQSALKVLGGEISKIKEIILPCSDNRRTIIEIVCVKQLANKYPRKAGVPTTLPL